MPRLLCSELSGDGLELVNMYFYDIRYESTTSHTNLPEVCSNLSTRNMRQTKNHFWPPAWDTRPVVPLSWSPQRWYNCEEELWLTCWLHWTPPVSRCRGECWRTSLSRSPTSCYVLCRINIFFFGFWSYLTKTVFKGEIEHVGIVHILIARRVLTWSTFRGTTATKNINFHVFWQHWDKCFP